MNIAVVVLDTLRRDAFDEQFDWLPGCRFEQAWAPGNWTVPVHASLFTGRPPVELGVHAKHQTLDCPEPTLAELLADAGYRTRAFSANVNISPVFQFDRGFEEFQGSWRLAGMDSNVFDWETFIAQNQSRGPSRYLTALQQVFFGDVDTVGSLQRGLDIKLRDLGLRSKPPDDGAGTALDMVQSSRFGDEEFLFLNLMEAHAPYDPPAEYQSEIPGLEGRDWTTYNALLATATGHPPEPATADALRQAYDDSVRYLSDIYADIFAELTDAFDIVITLGDHGELFGEYDAWQHAYGLYPELTHVPLVVSGDAIETGSTDTVVSLTDVFHTVCQLAAVSDCDPERALVDSDGQPREETRPVYTEYHGVNSRNREAVEGAGYDSEPYDDQLFGAADGDGQYGYQTRDGFVAPESHREELESLVESYISSVETRTLGADDDLPESVKRQLEDLGYA